LTFHTEKVGFEPTEPLQTLQLSKLTP